MSDAEKLRKTASLGNNVYSPWPQKELNEAADRIEELEAEVRQLRHKLWNEGGE